jgi:mercuric ion binding protein
MIKKTIILAVALLLMCGYYVEAAEQKVIMEIEGLTCALCPIAVKKALSKVDGVRDITISQDDEKAWLIVQDSVTDETLYDAVKKAGPYKGRVIQRTASE